ncbi:glycosyltransferase [Xanthomarina sp. F1114]|uniref:glycosyltransferase n=1 Tax=Xanthomarina sp. F1114 TaxID=2996019 RepID=UPI00225E6C2B|nr:glycosyltransferase [Xanthomarina sp. F1114]MCX7546560.1 glycosyltransferase [Xanthomarina sp. F1114]
MVQERVGIVTVTYGNRSAYFSKLIESAVKHPNVVNIVVVCNGIEQESKTCLNKLEEENKTKLIVHDLGYNSGSAKGFKEGILRVLQEDIDFIWLLDDDNLPKSKALKLLLKSWSNYSTIKPLSLLSYRPQRKVYKDSIERKNPYLMLGTKNSFLGFNILDKLKKTKLEKQVTVESGEVAVAPYGGMFFSSKLINQIGLPDESFFLYADDHEFSYRITQNNGKIILILASELEDLETSFHLKKPKTILHTRYFSTDSKNAIYYSVRNNVYFEKNFITNRLIYFCNKFAYLIALFFIMLLYSKNFWKFKVIIKATRDSKKFKR